MSVMGATRRGPILEEVTERDDTWRKKPVPDFLTSVSVVTKHPPLVSFSIPPSTSIHHQGTAGPQHVFLVHPILSIFPGPSVQLPPELC